MQVPLPLDIDCQYEPNLENRERRLVDLRINVLRGDLARYRRLEMRAMEMLRNLGVEL